MGKTQTDFQTECKENTEKAEGGVILLPGYSRYNKEAQDQLANYLTGKGFQVEKVEWDHWQKPKGFSYTLEEEKILQAVERLGQNYAVVAKSVGTRVAAEMVLLQKISPSKMVLMGIPSLSNVYERAFSGVEGTKITVIQNTNDPFVSSRQIKKFFKSVNPKIRVIEKEAEDHNYLYPHTIHKLLLT